MRNLAPRRILARLRKLLFRRVPQMQVHGHPHFFAPAMVQHDRYTASLSGARHRAGGLHN